MRPIISTLHTQNDVTAILSTTKTQLGGSTVILPAWAKSILAVVPKVINTTSVAAQSINGLVEVESNDLSLMPFQCFPSPVGSLLGTMNNNVAKPEIYQINAPCNGGEQVNLYGTALVALTTMLGWAGATLIVSNMRPTAPNGQLAKQRHAKVGSITGTGTTAGSDVAGTRYNFSGAEHIVELQAIVTPLVRAATDGMSGYLKYTSNEFDGVADVKMDFSPICGGIATVDSCYIDGASRLKGIDIPVAAGQVNIQDYCYFGKIGSAGNFCSGLIYE